MSKTKTKKRISGTRRMKAATYRRGYADGRDATLAEYVGDSGERGDVMSAIRAVETLLPQANWSISKGALTDDEPLYAAVIFDGIQPIGMAEGDDPAATVREALALAQSGTWSDPMGENPAEQCAIQKIALTAVKISRLANVPAMEMAGQLVSVLAANPELVESFMQDGMALFTSGKLDAQHGCLDFRAINGVRVSPQDLRKHMGMEQ